MAKIIVNLTAAPVTVRDVGGIIIPLSGTYTIPPQDWDLWAASSDIDTYINAGTLTVNDGYDNLPKEASKRHLHEESLPRSSAYAATAQTLNTSASTLTLTAASRLLYMFTGTVAGQIVKLPDTTTLPLGWKYEVWNNSTQPVSIQDSTGTTIFTVAVSQKTWITLQVNSTASGTWLFEANFQGGTGSGNGTISFGFDGNATAGRWLESLTNIASNLSSYVSAGSKAIRSISISTNGNSTLTITIFKNGVALDTITMSAVSKNSKLNLYWPLVDKDILTAQVTAQSSGGARIVCVLWL